MNSINLFKSIVRVFYHEGFRGLLARIKTRTKSKRLIKRHLDWSSFVLLKEKPTTVAGHASPSKNKTTFLMLIPEPERGSGGRMTMARVIRYLAARNMDCSVAFYPEVTNGQFAACANEWMDEFAFESTACKVLRLEEAGVRTFDIAMATYWPGAYVVKNCISAASKGYLVQDFEPAFHPPGSMFAFAEETYRMGLWGICASPWLAEMLSAKYGMQTEAFLLGIDKKEYYLEKSITRENNLAVAYIRRHTERRGYELIMWALKTLKDRMPGVRIEIFGDERFPSKFLWIDRNHGVLRHAELRALYNRASVGIVTSFTNYSLIPNEMIACGCAVVELDTPCTRSSFPPGVVSLERATPQHLAQAAQVLLADQNHRKIQIQNGLKYIEAISWEQSLATVYAAIQKFSTQSK